MKARALILATWALTLLAWPLPDYAQAVDEGEREYRVEELVVEGNARTHELFIRRWMHLDTGVVTTEDEIILSARTLAAEMGFIEVHARSEPIEGLEPDEKGRERKRVVVEVRERIWTLWPYIPSISYDLLRGWNYSWGFNEYNLLNNLWTLDASAGYQADWKFYAQATLSAPYALPRLKSLKFTASYSDAKKQVLDESLSTVLYQDWTKVVSGSMYLDFESADSVDSLFTIDPYFRITNRDLEIDAQSQRPAAQELCLKLPFTFGGIKSGPFSSFLSCNLYYFCRTAFDSQGYTLASTDMPDGFSVEPSLLLSLAWKDTKPIASLTKGYYCGLSLTAVPIISAGGMEGRIYGGPSASLDFPLFGFFQTHLGAGLSLYNFDQTTVNTITGATEVFRSQMNASGSLSFHSVLWDRLGFLELLELRGSLSQSCIFTTHFSLPLSATLSFDFKGIPFWVPMLTVSGDFMELAKGRSIVQTISITVKLI